MKKTLTQDRAKNSKQVVAATHFIESFKPENPKNPMVYRVIGNSPYPYVGWWTSEEEDAKTELGLAIKHKAKKCDAIGHLIPIRQEIRFT